MGRVGALTLACLLAAGATTAADPEMAWRRFGSPPSAQVTRRLRAAGSPELAWRDAGPW
jgi:hypothetical protein